MTYSAFAVTRGERAKKTHRARKCVFSLGHFGTSALNWTTRAGPLRRFAKSRIFVRFRALSCAFVRAGQEAPAKSCTFVHFRAWSGSSWNDSVVKEHAHRIPPR